MRRAITYVVFADTIFILLLCVAGFTGGVLSDCAYFSAFLVPTLLVLLLTSKKRRETSPPGLTLSPRAIPLLLPTVAPTVLLVLLISAATSLLLSKFTTLPTTDVSGSIGYVIFRHAVVTALLEEILFRYVPIMLISPHSKRITVFLSAILFALSHASLHQIPYAFVAGVIFCVLDLAFDSIWPSVFLHFLNNLASIFWVRHFDNKDFCTYYIIILAALAAISALSIILLRKRYSQLVKSATVGGKKERMPYAVWIFALMTLVIAATSI